MGVITAEMDYLADQLLALEKGTKLGGIYAFKPGYHATRADNQANWPGNYSIKDAVDKKGPSDKAAAIDWTFPDAQAGNYATIDRYSSRLLASGRDPDDHRLDGWREFYGQADHDAGVEGYDFRYNRDATSDASHLWHIHLSCSRELVASRENMDKLLSVLRGEPMTEPLTADQTRNAVCRRDGAIDNEWPDGYTIDGVDLSGGDESIQLQTQLNRLATVARKALEVLEDAFEMLGANAAALARIEAAIAAGPIPAPVSGVLTGDVVFTPNVAEPEV